VYTITLATLLFGEMLGPLQVVGGMLVIVGVVIAQTSDLGRMARPPAEQPAERGARL
jgi:drug/metabolite transporter (DMT)-like permease